MPSQNGRQHQAQNVYDNDEAFWDKYSQFPRMRQGLAGASEWPLFQPMWPPIAGLRVLDLGCGDSILGCYAAAQGASSVLGVDISQRMLERAQKNAADLVAAAATADGNGNKASVAKPTFAQMDLEDLQLGGRTFDLVVSGLALHYISDFEKLVERIYAALAPGGRFIFSIEHPMLTAPRRPGFLSHDARQGLSSKSQPSHDSFSTASLVSSIGRLSSNGNESSAASAAPSLSSSPSSSPTPSRVPTPSPLADETDEEYEDDDNDDKGGSPDTFWPVESYFVEGDRHVPWLGASVLKQHRTTATYFGLLKGAGFDVYDMAEWGSTADAGRKHPDWPEGVLPRFLILGARKPAAAA